MASLSGKVAVVTGGSTGIGLAAAKALKAAGAKVAITGRTQETLDAAVAEIGDALAIQADATKIDDNARTFQTVSQKLGKVDILFANAGIAKVAPIEGTDEATFDLTMDTNVKGVFFTVQKALPAMNDGGVIILTASSAAHMGMANFSAYSASKAAVRCFARAWAAELAPRKIRVVSVSPGAIETPIWGKIGLPQEQVQEMGGGVAEMTPLSRFGKADEVGATVAFLASDAASYITGADVGVDGGLAQV